MIVMATDSSTSANLIQFNLLNTVNVRTIATQVIIIAGNIRVH